MRLKSTVSLVLLWSMLAAVIPGQAMGMVQSAPPPAPDLFGIATQDFRTDLPLFQSKTGQYPSLYQLFWNIEAGWPVAWAPGLLDELSAMGVTPYVEVNTAGGDTAAYQDFVAGNLDGDLAAMVSMLATWLNADTDHRMVIAPFAEPNLPEHPWGGDPAGAIKSYKKVRQAFLDAGLGGDKVRFAWSVNGGISNGLTYADYYPGDPVVDVIGLSKLNRNNPWKDFDTIIGGYIDQIQGELSTTKPILVSQTGSVVEDGDRDQWLRDMFRSLAADEQVIGAIYFNRDKFEGGKANDYRIIKNGTVDPVVLAELGGWSAPAAASWLFDGRLDAWVAAREAAFQLSGGFLDSVGSIFAADIGWLAANGITKGCSTKLFCPGAPVTRGQMAAFLVRALALPPSTADTFTDDDGSVFEADIQALAAAGITFGCRASEYCPTKVVTRGQMAAFLRRAFESSIVIGEPVSFTDDDGSVFEADIRWLSGSGITRGCAADLYCPTAPVTRGQMAAFLHRAMG